MSNLLNLVGQKYGKLTVIELTDERDRARNRMWLCKCDCGNMHKVATTKLTKGIIRSCGCSHIDNIKRVHKSNTTHSMSKTKLYKVWAQMKNRCRKESRFAKYYADRGITVCEEWTNNFECFATWAKENGYAEGLTIDRIDNNSGYKPSNCRWVTMKVQSNNTRQNVFFTYNGETKTIQQWSDETGINHDTIRCRIKAGWPDELVLSRENYTGNNAEKNNRRK